MRFIHQEREKKYGKVEVVAAHKLTCTHARTRTRKVVINPASMPPTTTTYLVLLQTGVVVVQYSLLWTSQQMMLPRPDSLHGRFVAVLT